MAKKISVSSMVQASTQIGIASDTSAGQDAAGA
jgi:hypothetical protein